MHGLQAQLQVQVAGFWNADQYSGDSGGAGTVRESVS